MRSDLAPVSRTPIELVASSGVQLAQIIAFVQPEQAAGAAQIGAHLALLGKERDTVVVSFTQTMHTYQPILKLLAQSMQVGTAPVKDLEGDLVKTAYRHVQSHKTLYIVIDPLCQTSCRLLFSRRMIRWSDIHEPKTTFHRIQRTSVAQVA